MYDFLIDLCPLLQQLGHEWRSSCIC